MLDNNKIKEIELDYKSTKKYLLIQDGLIGLVILVLNVIPIKLYLE